MIIQDTLTQPEIISALETLSASEPCPVTVDHDRDGDYDRCLTCGKSWPSAGKFGRSRTECERAIIHLLTIAKKA